MKNMRNVSFHTRICSNIKPLNYAGMLMEMHITAIQRLLDSPTDLQKAVNRAVDTLNADAARK